MFMALLDVSITNVALPSIAAGTGASTSQLQWVVSGYTLSLGMVPVLAGRLGDDHGRRRMFQIGVGGFALTSAFAGLAPTAELLIAMRVLQGAFAGLVNPQTSGLIQQMFRGADRGRAFGFLGLTVGVSTAVGPVLGGALIALGGPDLGWRLIFFLNVPIGIAIAVLAQRHLPVAVAGTRQRLDVVGALMLGLATFCVLFACVQFDAARDGRLIALVIAAAVVGVLFYRRERRLTDADADPLVDLRLFRNPSYVAGIAQALLFFPASAGLPLVLAIYYQDGLGYTPLQSGLGVTAYAVGAAIAAPLAGRVVTRVGRPLVVAGAIAFGVGAVLLAVIASHAPAEHVALALSGPLFVMGCGQGMLISPNQTLALMEVDPRMGSTAGGVLQTGQRIGIAFGQAFIGAVFFTALVGSSKEDYSAALSAAVVAAVVLISLAIAFGVQDVLRTRRRIARA